MQDRKYCLQGIVIKHLTMFGHLQNVLTTSHLLISCINVNQTCRKELDTSAFSENIRLWLIAIQSSTLLNV